MLDISVPAMGCTMGDTIFCIDICHALVSLEGLVMSNTTMLGLGGGLGINPELMGVVTIILGASGM